MGSLRLYEISYQTFLPSSPLLFVGENGAKLGVVVSSLSVVVLLGSCAQCSEAEVKRTKTGRDQQ